MSKTVQSAGVEQTASHNDKPTFNSESPGKVVLTAYQHGPAVIHEDRHLELPAGTSRVYIGGLPSQFIENSSTIVAVRGNGKFALGPKSLRPANLSFHSILARAVNREVCFIDTNPDGSQRETTGILRHLVDNRYALLETKGKPGEVMLVPISQKYKLPEGLPAGLSNLSILAMDPKVSEAGKFTVELLYESGGINWQPKYEAFYDAAAKLLRRFACYVDLSNDSGTDFKDVTLNLIAGTNYSEDMAIAASRGPKASPMMRMSATLESFGGGMEPQADFEMEGAVVENVGEQKMYKLADPVTLENGIPNSPVLVFSENVPVEHEYHVYSSHPYQHPQSDKPEDLTKLPVNVKLRLRNDLAHRLGAALPPGSVRVFEPDSSGKLQKTDSSQVVSHVSDGEEFSLDLRNACKDLKHTRHLSYFHQDPLPTEESEEDKPAHLPIKPAGSRAGAAVHRPVKPGDLINENALQGDSAEKQKAKKQPRYATEERVVTIYNYKDEAVDVIVHESFPQNAEVLSGVEGFASLNNSSGFGTVKLNVQAKGRLVKGGEASFTYRIRYRIG